MLPRTYIAVLQHSRRRAHLALTGPDGRQVGSYGWADDPDLTVKPNPPASADEVLETIGWQRVHGCDWSPSDHQDPDSSLWTAEIEEGPQRFAVRVIREDGAALARKMIARRHDHTTD